MNQQPEFDLKVDPDRFCQLSKTDQDLFVESLSEKEKWQNMRLFKTLDDGGIGWAFVDHLTDTMARHEKP